MTISKVPALPINELLKKKQVSTSPPCTLKWRQGHLLVSVAQDNFQPELPALESKQWLVACLQHSPVRLIHIAPTIGAARLKLWADASAQAHKAIFLRLPSSYKRHLSVLESSDRREPPSCKVPIGGNHISSFAPLRLSAISRRRWWLSRFLSFGIAAVLLLLLSPLMLGLICLMRLEEPQPIFTRAWCVGERGKLFQCLKFRTASVNAQKLEHSDHNTPLRRWMHKYKLDELPQLFNVLRGEMSLFGSRPCSLYDAVRLSPQEQRQVNALPGILQFRQWRRTPTT